RVLRAVPWTAKRSPRLRLAPLKLTVRYVAGTTGATGAASPGRAGALAAADGAPLADVLLDHAAFCASGARPFEGALEAPLLPPLPAMAACNARSTMAPPGSLLGGQVYGSGGDS